MNRRAALAALAVSILPPVAEAQPPAKPFRIGFVANTIPTTDLVQRTSPHPAPRLFEEGLRERGWVDGKNIQILWRSAEGRYERKPAIFDELVRMSVDVLVVFDGQEEAMKRTRDVPIVMATSAPDSVLVERGLIASLARPGGNVTGVSTMVGRELTGKKLGLLKQAVPKVSRVAFFLLVARTGEDLGGFPAETLAAARELGITVFKVGFKIDELEQAFADALRKGADAIVMPGRAELQWPKPQQAIHELANRHRLPVIHEWLSAAESGGLMAYGIDPDWMYRRIPYFVDRILRGAKPSDLPVEQPSEFRLLVNVNAARAIGVSLPESVLIRADRVIR